MFENDIMLKSYRNDYFYKRFHHFHNNRIMISSTIITTKIIIIKIIIAINLVILVFRQIIKETINMIKINKKITITIFNLDIKILNQLINIFFQLINNNVLLKHFFRNKQHDKNLHKMHLFHFRRQFIITSSKKNILKKKLS